MTPSGEERKMTQMSYFQKITLTIENINLTIGINPSKVLDTKIVQNKNETKCFSHHKDNKLYFHWKPAVPRNYKKMS